MTTKAGVNESVPTVTESNGGEKDTSVESEEKENLKEPGDKETESAKPDKEAEEKSSVSSEILGITCVTKTGTLQQKFKTAFFTYAYKYDKSKVKTPFVETISICPFHSISS